MVHPAGRILYELENQPIGKIYNNNKKISHHLDLFKNIINFTGAAELHFAPSR